MSEPPEALAAFLAGERTDDVAIFVADAHLRNAGALADVAEPVEGGYVLVLPGDRGREVFPLVGGDAPMTFAQEAGQREGRVDRDLAGGTCPAVESGDDADHEVRFVLAFAQAETEEAGGRYAEGDVVHAYARCSCGTAYADRWVVGEE